MNFSIDFGLLNSSISYEKDDIINYIKFKDDNNKILTNISYSRSNNLKGYNINRKSLIDYNNTIFDIKRIIGKSFNQLDEENLKNWFYQITCDDNSNIFIELKYNNQLCKLSPVDITTDIFINMKNEINKTMEIDSKEILNIYLTVPTCFNNLQRTKIVEAANNAGFNVIRLINETTAAAIAYCYNHKNEEIKDRMILIYDFGAGSFNASIVIINCVFPKASIKVITSNGKDNLGGIEIDNNIVKYYSRLYKESSGKDLLYDDKLRSKLYELKDECEKAKILLSTKTSAPINCDFLSYAIGPQELRRATLDSLNNNIYRQTIGIVNNLFIYSSINKDDLYEIVLAGGSSNIYTIQQMLSLFLNKPIDKSIDPQEIISFGTTILSSNMIPDLTIQDITSYSLSTDVDENEVLVMIPKNTQIPYTFEETLFTTYDNQKEMIVKVFEGEGNKQQDYKLANIYKINNLPDGSTGSVKIIMKYIINESGILNVENEII